MDDLTTRLRRPVTRFNAEVALLCEAAQQGADEIDRLNKALRYEENRTGRLGTHGDNCHTWGPSHYECLVRHLKKIEEQGNVKHD